MALGNVALGEVSLLSVWLLGGCHCEFILHVIGRNPFHKQGLVRMQATNGQRLPVFAGLVGETT